LFAVSTMATKTAIAMEDFLQRSCTRIDALQEVHKNDQLRYNKIVSDLNQHDQALQEIKYEMKIFTQQIKEHQIYQRKEIIKSLVLDLELRYQEYHHFVSRTKLVSVFPQEKQKRWVQILDRLHQATQIRSHPGLNQYQNLTWEELGQLINLEFPVADLKLDLLEIFKFVRNDMKLIKQPFMKWSRL
jgi:hypothetical protein